MAAMTPEMEGLIAALTAELDTTKPDFDKSPLWLLVAKNASIAIAGAKDGQLGLKDLEDAYGICKEYKSRLKPPLSA